MTLSNLWPYASIYIHVKIIKSTVKCVFLRFFVCRVRTVLPSSWSVCISTGWWKRVCWDLQSGGFCCFNCYTAVYVQKITKHIIRTKGYAKFSLMVQLGRGLPLLILTHYCSIINPDQNIKIILIVLSIFKMSEQF